MPSRCVDMRESLPTTYRSRSKSDIANIVVHHSGEAPLDMSPEAAARATARYHIEDNGWPGCGYHVIIVRDGSWAYCNSLTVISYHAGGVNNVRGVGVCLWGDYRIGPVPAAMVDSLEEICRWIMQEKRAWAEDTGAAYVAPTIVGHRDVSATTCPGDYGAAATEEVRRRLA